ncbi:RNA-binding protein PIN4 [Spathaspora sp. JA1]|nr:RNA-binding protein PIN4 [Spathaspora sp. JA1]
MDLRNLSPAPNQMDSVMQRHPSISSLSSTSGYASSTYGGVGGGPPGGVPGSAGGNLHMTSGSNSNNNTHANNTPLLTNQRLATVANASNNSRNVNNLQASWLNQSISNSTVTATNVGPWVEQQQQQQQSALQSLDAGTQAALGMPPKGLGDRSLSSTSSTKNEEQQQHHNHPHNHSNLHSPNNESANDTLNVSINMTNDHDGAGADDDDLIPTAIVIKNIPFAIKKEQLLDVMTKLNLPLPYAFNYHFDNGVFRGLAFANFTSTDETSLVVNQLNGREIGGRKLRVEYKKMLPFQERERIEREKREKRGQLEEQHRTNSNASLASLMSAASTTAATKNLSINGATPSGGSTTERLFVNLPFTTTSVISPPLELNFNDPEILELYTQLVLYRDDISKSIYELAISPATLNINQRKSLSIVANYLNLLELFDNGLIIIRRKPGYIGQSIIQQASLGAQQQPPPLIPPHSSSMMNLAQLGATITGANPSHPELMRSQSQSAMQMPRLRQQASTPVQQTFPQYSSQQPQQQQQSQQQQPQQQQPQQQQQQRQYAQNQSFNVYQQQQAQQIQYQQQIPQPQAITPTVGSSSAAALLRSSSNRSYVDVRATPPLSNNFVHQQQQQQPSSVTNSPNAHHNQVQYQHSHLQQQQSYYQAQGNTQQHQQQQQAQGGSSDIGSRFQPFGQHTQLTGSFTSLSQSSSLQNISGVNNGGQQQQLDEFGNGVPGDLSSKFNSLALGGNNQGVENLNSGIWGRK